MTRDIREQEQWTIHLRDTILFDFRRVNTGQLNYSQLTDAVAKLKFFQTSRAVENNLEITPPEWNENRLTLSLIYGLGSASYAA